MTQHSLYVVFFLIAAILGWQGPTDALPDSEHSWGICIGISEYQPQDLSLNWANKDAIDFCTSFLRYGLGLPETHYYILKDRDATRQNILERLAWLVGSADNQDRVYIFYSGHGTPESPFLPHNSQQQISLEEIKKYLRKIYARDVIVFADACYSGRLAGKGAKAVLEQHNITGLSKEVVDDIGSARTNILVMTSARGIQRAYEQHENKNGLFTYYLMKALMEQHEFKAADRDHNDELTVYEVYQYLYQHVTQHSEQEPQLSDIQGAKQLVLLRKEGLQETSAVPTSTPVKTAPPAGSDEMAYTWVDMLTEKAAVIRQEVERLSAKRKVLGIAESIESATADKIRGQIQDINQNITELLTEYSGMFQQLAPFEPSFIEKAFARYLQEGTKSGATGHTELPRLIQRHFHEYSAQGQNIEQWRKDFEQFSAE